MSYCTINTWEATSGNPDVIQWSCFSAGDGKSCVTVSRCLVCGVNHTDWVWRGIQPITAVSFYSVHTLWRERPEESVSYLPASFGRHGVPQNCMDSYVHRKQMFGDMQVKMWLDVDFEFLTKLGCLTIIWRLHCVCFKICSEGERGMDWGHYGYMDCVLTTRLLGSLLLTF